MVRTFGGGDFIPNDTVIGIADVSCRNVKKIFLVFDQSVTKKIFQC